MQQNKQLNIKKVAMQIITDTWITGEILQLRITYTTKTILILQGN